MVPPLAVLAINGRLFVRAARARADTITLPWKFAITGFLFLGVSWFLTLNVGNALTNIVWPRPVGQSDPGLYDWILPSLMFLIALLLYVKVLVRFGRRDDTSAGFGATPVY